MHFQKRRRFCFYDSTLNTVSRHTLVRRVHPRFADPIEMPDGVRVTYFDKRTNARISATTSVASTVDLRFFSRPASAVLPSGIEPLTQMQVRQRMIWKAQVEREHERSVGRLVTGYAASKASLRSHGTQSKPRLIGSAGSFRSIPSSIAVTPNLRWEDPIAASKHDLALLEGDLQMDRYPPNRYPLGHPLGRPLGTSASAAELLQRRCAIQAAEKTREIMERHRRNQVGRPPALAAFSSSTDHMGPMGGGRTVSRTASITPSSTVSFAVESTCTAAHSGQLEPPAPPLANQPIDRSALKKNSAMVRSAVEGLNSRFSNMMKAFQYVDLDRSGTLNKKELARALDLWNIPIDNAKLDELIAACDDDGNGEVNYKEFVDALARDTVAPAAMGKRDMQAKEAMGQDDVEVLSEHIKRRPTKTNERFSINELDMYR